MKPVFLEPSCKDAIWGGMRLKKEFGKKGGDRIAETWELSCHDNGPSIIRTGPYAGRALTEYFKENRSAFGTACKKFDSFPLLVKLIDAKKDLSIQVHPDNAYALSHEGQYGKMEMWYVIDCEPGAKLFYGFSKKMTKEQFVQKIQDHTLPDALNAVPVKKGDVFFIPAGTVHSIGGGILLAEIQQNSDVTYRIYDYGRLGTDGKPRPLHIEKAAQTANLDPVVPDSRPQGKPSREEGAVRTLLACCEYFKTEHIELNGEISLFAGEASFHCLLFLDGEAVLHTGSAEVFRAVKGDTVFLPAGMGSYSLSGKAGLLVVSLP